MGINDLYIQESPWRGDNVVTIAKASDPLLRRFGQCDFIQLGAGEKLEVHRHSADEVWSVITGRAAFHLTDLREDSSSFQAEQAFTLDSQTPQSLLIPFGVTCTIKTDQACAIIRLTTHQDEDFRGDRTP